MRPGDYIRAGIGISSAFLSTVSTSTTASSVASSTRTSTRSSTASSTASPSVEPCSLIAGYGNAGSPLPASLAYACLASVPVDVTGDSKLIDELKLLWQWHSEIGWLKNTPSTWDLGPIDLIKELDYIKGNLSSYDSEFDVQSDIQSLVTRTGNFHFNYLPDILQIFSFQRTYAVASISDDGKSLPKVYVVSDIAQKSINNAISISPITKINDEDVVAFLQDVGSYSQYTNIDARYNYVFFRAGASGSQGSFVIQDAYQGDWSNITFANGTNKAVQNIAVATQNFTSAITDGSSFFENFCQGQISGFANASPIFSFKGSPIKKRAAIPTDYPTPVVEHSGGAVAGYFLQDAGFQDVAILKIITFDPVGDPTGNEFQSVVAQFIGNATAAKKTKLILDLRENGGGATNLLLDTFMQLFPGEIPFSAQRYRAQDQFMLIGDRVNQIYNNPTMSALYTQETGDDIASDFRFWAYWHFLDVNNNNFPSWNAFSGPHVYNNDNFTTTMRYNLSNSDRISVGFNQNFYFSNITAHPFQFSVDNTVMMLDGLCGSSCASFHEEIKNVAGAKSVVIGGRPQTGPMQVPGGTKGGEVIPVNNFVQYGSHIIEVVQNVSAKTLSGTVVEKLANVTQALLRVGDDSSRIQTQDQIRKGDDSETPLQYIYEAADCRIWLTSQALFSPAAAWEAVWSAHTNSSLCVQGSFGDKSSISGGFKPYGPGPLNGKMNQTGNTPNTTNSTASPTNKPPQVTTNAAVVFGPQTLFTVAAAVVALIAL